MNTTATTPVTIVQELIAILIARAELAEKIEQGSGDEKVKQEFTSIVAQSHAFNQELLQELSQFGDAVGEVTRENEYIRLSKQFRKESSGPDDRQRSAFSEMETELKSFYQINLESGNLLPQSLADMMNRQLKELSDSK